METNISNKYKAYTSLEQSKKLAEILPHKSADGTWEKVSICGAKVDIPEDMQYRHKEIPFFIYSGIGIPCWSLAALLEIIPYRLNDGSDFTIEKWEDGYLVAYSASCHKYGNELVDACIEMIIKLYEQKLL